MEKMWCSRKDSKEIFWFWRLCYRYRVLQTTNLYDKPLEQYRSQNSRFVIAYFVFHIYRIRVLCPRFYFVYRFDWCVINAINTEEKTIMKSNSANCCHNHIRTDFRCSSIFRSYSLIFVQTQNFPLRFSVASVYLFW